MNGKKVTEAIAGETIPAEKYGVDLTFRPKTYWPVTKKDKKVLSRIKGKVRRDAARRILEAGGTLDDVPGLFSEAKLSNLDRQYWGALHPRNMGGEYLPDLPPRTVEIVRISLESTTADQWSVRATREKDRIVYSVKDEYGTKFELAFTESEKPLTLGELIHFIDNSRHPDDVCGGHGLFLSNWAWIISEENDYEQAFQFASIDSDFYPELSSYYCGVAAEWAEEIEADRRESGWYDDEEVEENTNAGSSGGG